MTDIAHQVGVSQAAVSCVLNGGARGIRVGEKTAERIRLIAKKLNFHPNHAAQQLAGKRSGIVAALAGKWEDDTQTRLFSWLNIKARELGLEILAGQVDSKMPFDVYVQKCLSWNVDGLIYVALSNDSSWRQAAESLTALPRVVSVIGNPEIPGSRRVESDVGAGVRLAVEHLHRQGRRKIVQVLNDVTTQLNIRRRHAFLDAHELLERPVSDDLLCVALAGWEAVSRPQDMLICSAVCNEIIDQRKPDAILAPDDFVAAEFIRTLRRRGVRVPDDVAIVGWGNEQSTVWVDPPITTVSYQFSKVTEAAFQMLDDMWNENGTDPTGDQSAGNEVRMSPPTRAETTIIPTRLLVRGTA